MWTAISYETYPGTPGCLNALGAWRSNRLPSLLSQTILDKDALFNSINCSKT